jgi:dTDP-4-dehydrorhamnose reductase
MSDETPLQLWAGLECTVNRVHDAHFDQLARSGHDQRLTDLDLLADLGVRRVRYPVLWERTRDWRWADERLGRLRELHIEPIVGLVHHGSGPLATSLLEDSFGAGLAEFAHRVAERYPWVRYWTPVNEPLTTARLSCLYGYWYPHHRNAMSFARALLSQVRAVVLAMRAIRNVIPDAKLVQTDDLGKTHATPELAYQAEHENERRWVTWDLLCGRRTGIDGWLGWIGIAEDERRWFEENPCPPDILGINHYLSSERFLDHRLERYPEHLHGSNGKDRYVDELALRVLGPGADGPDAMLLEAWERYRLPLAVTEAHNGCTREEQLRWLRDVWNGALAARSAGADVRAVTVWSLLGTYGWCDLVAHGLESYEPGVYDLRAPAPRPTAVASMAKALAAGEAYTPPALDGPGWWERPERLWYPPVGAVAQPRPRRERRLLITGATGTLGGALTRICVDRGLATRPTFRDELDLTDKESVVDALSALRPWAVVNAAGYVRVDDAEVEDAACLAVNRDGAALLAEACAAFRVPLVTFSSDLVFDGASARPYVESEPVAPLSVYGRSKAEADARVLEAHDDALVLRTSAFFGPWDVHNFAAAVLLALAAGETFAAADDVIVSPTYVPDLAHATVDLLIDGERGLWHLANDGALSWASFARRLAEATELDARLVRGVPAATLRWIAPRPCYSALVSERGWIMPTLDDAITRYGASTRVPRTDMPRSASLPNFST